MSSIALRKVPDGTTLIETIVAVGILAIVLLSAAGLLAVGNRQIESAGHATRALAVAESALAELSVGGWLPLLERFGCDTTATTCLAHNPPLDNVLDDELPRPELLLRLTAIDDAALGATLALRISVEVSWVEGLRERRLLLGTLRT